MKHLTPQEIVSIADQLLANGERRAALSHLEECSRCRREVEFQRTVRSTAKANSTMHVSAEFNSRVFARLGIQRKQSQRFFGLIGNIFALMMVIGLFGMVVSVLSSVGMGDLDNSKTIANNIGTGLEKMLPSLSSDTKKLSVVSESWTAFLARFGGHQKTFSLVGMVVLALFALVALDRLLQRVAIKPKSR